MKKLLAVLLLLGSSSFSFAQQSISQGGCGTVTSQEELQSVYDFVQHNPAAYAKGSATVDTIPLTIHIVGDNDGNGYYSITDLFKVICQLNERFKPVNFYYYIKWPIRYINNTSYYVHNYTSGAQMMRANNVNGTVNVYFVDDPAGACGYYTYGQDAVAIKKSCSGNNSTTVAHELGHFFSLPHTFSGWENNATPSNPEAVRRTGSGANCNSRGDGFCDTDADYVSDRWNCPLVTTKRDQFGDLYKPDSSLYMSYSSDNCQSRFSAQQIAKMQNNLQTASNRNAIRNAIHPANLALDTSRFVYPAPIMYSNHKKVVWNRMPGASYYYVRFSITLIPGLFRQTTLTADTSINIDFPVVNNGEYRVTISPVGAYDVCMNKTQFMDFTYTDATGNLAVNVTGNEAADLQLYPNPMNTGTDLGVRLSGIPADKYQVVITNTAGETVHTAALQTQGGTGTHSLQLPSLANGLYFVRCSSSQLQITRKLVIAH